jgi:predicted GNAT superfamily acetyltransferase
MDEITIRRASSIADYHACQEVQRRAWGLVDESYLVPVATMVAAQHHGGLVLGAFRADGDAVGMSFAFLGRIAGRICLYSQLTGIIAEFQDRGLGSRLKFAQRAIAREDGLETIAWAFDPLQAGNARFNLARLGATCSRYIVDMYGPRTDALNLGTPTDRLIAEWPTTESKPLEIPFEEAFRLPSLLELDTDASPPVLRSLEPPPHLWAKLEIPHDLARLRGSHPDLASSWRLAARHAFRTAFERGYRAVSFARGEIDDQSRCFYVLQPAEAAIV